MPQRLGDTIQEVCSCQRLAGMGRQSSNHSANRLKGYNNDNDFKQSKGSSVKPVSIRRANSRLDDTPRSSKTFHGLPGPDKVLGPDDCRSDGALSGEVFTSKEYKGKPPLVSCIPFCLKPPSWTLQI